ncbi:potassium-transporting ATPase subunit F [Microbacterium sp. bgisy207]
MIVISLLSLLLAIGAVVYLVAALLAPEKF